jgi:hypothetical protein
MDTLLPSKAGGLLSLGLLESGFEDFHASFLNTAPAALRRAYRLALVVAAWVSPVLVRRAPPLTRLAAPDRERALEAMARSRSATLRQLLTLLKTVAAWHYGAQPPVRRAVGHRG